MLQISHISKTFNPGTVNEKKALNGVDLHLGSGDFVTILGSNGAGKSTLFGAIAGSWWTREPSVWTGRISPVFRIISAANSLAGSFRTP